MYSAHSYISGEQPIKTRLNSTLQRPKPGASFITILIKLFQSGRGITVNIDRRHGLEGTVS